MNHENDNTVNPYIALADLCINLVLILAFFVAATNCLGRAGWEQVKYKESQEAFEAAVAKSLPANIRPIVHRGKNDPPGAQRWVYPQKLLFKHGTAELLPDGKHSLILFAKTLKQNKGFWRRVRVEGHTIPPKIGEPDNWGLSAARSATVACVIHKYGHIPSYYLAVSGRAGQNPLDKANRLNPENERVEIIVEYAQPQFGSTKPNK